MEDSSAKTFSESARVFTYFIYVSTTARLTIDLTKKKEKNSRCSVDVHSLFQSSIFHAKGKKERFSRKYGNTNHVLPFVKNSIVGKEGSTAPNANLV